MVSREVSRAGEEEEEEEEEGEEVVGLALEEEEEAPDAEVVEEEVPEVVVVVVMAVEEGRGMEEEEEFEEDPPPITHALTKFSSGVVVVSTRLPVQALCLIPPPTPPSPTFTPSFALGPAYTLPLPPPSTPNCSMIMPRVTTTIRPHPLGRAPTGVYSRMSMGCPRGGVMSRLRPASSPYARAPVSLAHRKPVEVGRRWVGEGGVGIKEEEGGPPAPAPAASPPPGLPAVALAKQGRVAKGTQVLVAAAPAPEGEPPPTAAAAAAAAPPPSRAPWGGVRNTPSTAPPPLL